MTDMEVAMDQVWGVEVSTTHGYRVYHAAVESPEDAKQYVLEMTEDEEPHIEAVGLVDNLLHLKPGACKQVLPM
jgi:hypothetical protein